MTSSPFLKIRPRYAYGSENSQSWYFLGYKKKSDRILSERAYILRRYCNDGDVWWGIAWEIPTHENGFTKIEKELDLARQAIEILKKDWQLHLQFPS